MDRITRLNPVVAAPQGTNTTARAILLPKRQEGRSNGDIGNLPKSTALSAARKEATVVVVSLLKLNLSEIHYSKK